MEPTIYLDYAATTPVDPRVAAVMLQHLTGADAFGNAASSSHAFGTKAKAAIEAARAEVAAILNATPEEIIWTSGATEAINLALKGAAQIYQRKGKHIVTVKTEHKAVLDTCQQFEKNGYSVTYLTPEPDGLLDVEKFTAALRADTILVSIMQVNNEIGVMQNIAALAKITASREILFHVDAAQSIGKIPLDVQVVPVDMVSLSAHKIYGPKGVGALYVRRKPRVQLAAQMHGGGHEQGIRSGTLPTHQIVGMGEALRIARVEMASDYQNVTALRHRFLQKISGLENVRVNGNVAQSYPGIINVSFAGITAEKFIQALPELAVSAGSACGKGGEPSYVLRALGLSSLEAQTGVRFSFGRFTRAEEMDLAGEAVLGFFQNNKTDK